MKEQQQSSSNSAHDDVFNKVSHAVTEAEWILYKPLIDEINQLKKEKNAVILAHNYQPAEIFHGVADITGDSLQLARIAQDVSADTIVMCGVHFMAETAKLLNPTRKVLLPDADAGCSLAESITAEDVRGLRAKYPGVPIVTYVNTSTAVKAESDICCTSSNAVDIVESLGVDRVIMIPDQYLASYVAAQTDVEIIDWKGECIVHEKFEVADIDALRRQYPGIHVIAHPECQRPVQEAADMVGSTSALMKYVEDNRPKQVAMITECTMSDNLVAAFPTVQFLQPCSICPYMRKITLEKILRSLKEDVVEIEIPQDVAERAHQAVTRMLDAS